MRSLAIVRDDIHLAQMNCAAQIERALLRDSRLRGQSVQQLEHGLNSTQAARSADCGS